MHQLTDSPSGLTYFLGLWGQNVKIKFSGNYGGTKCHPCTQKLIILHTNESSSLTKN